MRRRAPAAAVVAAVAAVLAAAPASPAASSVLFFTCADPERGHHEADICRIDPDERGARRLTSDAIEVGGYTFPSLSRDATRLAYARGGRDYGAFVAPASLSSPSEVFAGQAWEVALSPDGRRVAYVETRPPVGDEPQSQGVPVLFTVNSDGTDRREWGRRLMDPTWVGDRLAAVEGGLDGGKRACILQEGTGVCERVIAQIEEGEIEQPAVSPDGKLTIAKVSNPEFFKHRPGLWAFSTATGRPTGGILGGLGSHDPAWSPDGRAVAYIDGSSLEVHARPGSKDDRGTPGYTLWNRLQKPAAGHPTWAGTLGSRRPSIKITSMRVRGRKATIRGTLASGARERLRAQFFRGGSSVTGRTFHVKPKKGRFAFTHTIPKEHPGDGHWWCGINLSYPGDAAHGWGVTYRRPKGGICE